MQRAVVGLSKTNGTYKVPKFSECLVEYFSKEANSVTVNFSLENGHLVLNETAEGYELKHSPVCPIKLLPRSELEFDNSINNALKTTSIGVATSVVIESSDSHVLLTKRSSRMRSSPNVWVMPGGHLECGETVFQAGAREAKEETGLDISQQKAHVLGLWENVYPLLLGVGKPKYHILVVYLHTQLNETHEQLTKKLIPNPVEVDSYCWLDCSTISGLFSKNKRLNDMGKQFVFKNNKIVEKTLDSSKMFNIWLWRQPEAYSGTNYALRKWMEKKSENPSCKF